MPTVRRFAGLRVTIYSNDHLPAHVHVIGGGAEAVFDLHCPDGPPELRENYGFAQRVVSTIRTALQDDLAFLCDLWRSIHGNS
jgi:hypothetical protein